MQAVYASYVVVSVLLALLLTLSLLGRLKLGPGTQRTLAGLLALTVVSGVALVLLLRSVAPEAPLQVSAEDRLGAFIRSLPEEARGEDAPATRARIIALTRDARRGQEGSIPTAEIGEMLEQMRADITAAAALAESQAERIEALEAANRDLRVEAGVTR